MNTLIKYPGGKEKEIPIIKASLPHKIKNYYEPFVGGGAVYFSVDNADMYYINDKSEELVLLYEMVKTQDEKFFAILEMVNEAWKYISRFTMEEKTALASLYRGDISVGHFAKTYGSLFVENVIKQGFEKGYAVFERQLMKNLRNKLMRMSKLEAVKGKLSTNDISDNIECAIKSAFYMYFRDIYNASSVSSQLQAVAYFVMRNLCYSSMFRYNKDGKFNVPYGGISYNSKTFDAKIKQYRDTEFIGRLQKTDIGNQDFYDFMNGKSLRKDDFVFLDPPYDTEFSTYAKNEFGQDDQKRLANYLINECKARFMLVIKNTDYIGSLYSVDKSTANGGKINIKLFEKRYMVSFQNRNNKEAEHLLICNY